MMDQATIDVLERLRAGLEEMGALIDRTEQGVARILKNVKAGPAPLLSVAKGVAIGQHEQADRGKLATMFGVAGHGRFWADGSNSLRVFPDGSFLVQFDKARMGEGGQNTGGSSWVNAWIPLPRKVATARISYTLVIDPNNRGIPKDFWGESMKLPGLGRWVEGIAPGGGEVTLENFSARPTVSNWNKDGVSLRLGPYLYGQEQAHMTSPVEVWAKDYPKGTLRWWTLGVGPELKPFSGREIKTEMVIDGRGGQALITQTVIGADGSPVSAQWPMDLLNPDRPTEIDGVPFCFMYGGDSAKYGPSAAITEVLVKDFQVVEIS